MSNLKTHIFNPRHRSASLLLMLLALLVLGAGLGLRDPWPADEPRFNLVAKTMVETGNYLIPHRGQEIYPDKPPMFMWVQSAAYKVFANWRIAFLLPSLLAGLGTLFLVYDLTRRLSGRRSAFCATIFLLLCVQFTWVMKQAQIDPMLCFLVTLASYGLLRHALIKRDYFWYSVGWFAAGLGVITKGVGIIALFVLLPYWWAHRNNWRGLSVVEHAQSRWWLGPLALFAALAIWLAPLLFAALSKSDPALDAYLREILLGQTARRYADPSHHIQPPWYFLVVIFTTWVPLVLLLPWAIGAWRNRLRRKQAKILLPLCTVIFIVLFFTLSPGKRDLYILPALPLFAIAMAPFLPALLRRKSVQRSLQIYAVTVGLLLLTTALVACFSDPAFERKLNAERGIDSDTLGIWWMLSSAALAGVLALLALRKSRVVWGLAVQWLFLWLCFGLLIAPKLNPSSSGQLLMQAVAQTIGPNAELGLVAWKEQTLLHADRAVTEFGFLRDVPEQFNAGVKWLRDAPDQRWILTQVSALPKCVLRSQITKLGASNRRQWVLLQSNAVPADCIAK